MEAKPPEREAIMPRRIFRSRAYQLAQDPESLVRMTLSGNLEDNSHATRCGLTGLAGCMARPSSVFHHSPAFLTIPSRQPESCLDSNKGSRARSVSPASRTRLTSIG